MNILEFRFFCKKYGIIFPEFEFEYYQNKSCRCIVTWYNKDKISILGNISNNEEESIISALEYVNAYLKYEKNCLLLIKLSKKID